MRDLCPVEIQAQVKSERDCFLSIIDMNSWSSSNCLGFSFSFEDFNFNFACLAKKWSNFTLTRWSCLSNIKFVLLYRWLQISWFVISYKANPKETCCCCLAQRKHMQRKTINRRTGWFCSAVKFSALFQGVFPCALFPIRMRRFLKSFLSSRNVGNQFWELGRAFIGAGWLVASFQSLGIEESGWLLGFQLEEASLLNWKAELHQNYKGESRCKEAK